jgi:beta-glucosidase
MPPLPAFPDGFVWGAATSAYQIEGSPLADGAGPSNWHRFAHSPAAMEGGATGDVACDHYVRWREDVTLMRRLGLQAYRFSVAWSRILPDGTGTVNQKGLDFYRRLVEALREEGIRPFLTLYHWDHPAALDDRGGWLNRDSAAWFADYASVLYRALDGLVEDWTTLNEPWVVADAGHLTGVHAPGHWSPFEAPRVAHNLLRAHAEAVRAFRAEGNGRIGLAVNIEPKYAASDRPEDLHATALAEAYMNRQFLDPLLLGGYPEELREIYGEAWPEIPSADLDLLATPFDFLGVNYYTRQVVRHDPTAFPGHAGRVAEPRHDVMTTGWEVYPEGLFDTLVWVSSRYRGLPLFVTENGSAFHDPPSPLADPHPDPLRTDLLRGHLDAVRRALAAGVDLRGYFAWSLMDNLEWSAGFSRRFGLVHVDFASQKRTPKESAILYADVIRTNGACLDEG